MDWEVAHFPALKAYPWGPGFAVSAADGVHPVRALAHIGSAEGVFALDVAGPVLCARSCRCERLGGVHSPACPAAGRGGHCPTARGRRAHSRHGSAAGDCTGRRGLRTAGLGADGAGHGIAAAVVAAHNRLVVVGMSCRSVSRWRKRHYLRLATWRALARTV